MNVYILGKILSSTGKDHEKREVFSMEGGVATIAATSYKDPPKVLEEYYLNKKMQDYVLSTKRGGFNFVNPSVCHAITTRIEAGVGTFVSDDIAFIEHPDATLGGTTPTIIHMKNGDVYEYDGKEYRKVKCVEAGKMHGGKWDKVDEMHRRVYDTDGASPSITAVCGGLQEKKIVEKKPIVIGNYTPSGHSNTNVISGEGMCQTVMENHGMFNAIVETVPLRLERTEECKAKRRETKDKGMSFKEGKYLAPRDDGMTGTITTFDKDALVAEIKIRSATKSGYETAEDGDCIDLQFPGSETRRGRVQGERCGSLMTSDTFGVIAASRGRGDDNHHELEIGGEVSNTLTSVQKDKLYIEPQFRIRKQTETECFRLMGVKDEDSSRVHENQCKSSMYHLAGDSIVTSVLMAIFGEMAGIDWQTKVKELTQDLTKEWREDNGKGN